MVNYRQQLYTPNIFFRPKPSPSKPHLAFIVRIPSTLVLHLGGSWTLPDAAWILEVLPVSKHESPSKSNHFNSFFIGWEQRVSPYLVKQGWTIIIQKEVYQSFEMVVDFQGRKRGIIGLHHRIARKTISGSNMTECRHQKFLKPFFWFVKLFPYTKKKPTTSSTSSREAWPPAHRQATWFEPLILCQWNHHGAWVFFCAFSTQQAGPKNQYKTGPGSLFYHFIKWSTSPLEDDANP